MKITEEMIDQYDEITDAVMITLEKYAHIILEVKDDDYYTWRHYKERGIKIKDVEIGYTLINATAVIFCGYGQDGYYKDVDFKIPLSYVWENGWETEIELKYEKILNTRKAIAAERENKKKKDQLCALKKQVEELENET